VARAGAERGAQFVVPARPQDDDLAFGVVEQPGDVVGVEPRGSVS
jgi:hypothetical protein